MENIKKELQGIIKELEYSAFNLCNKKVEDLPKGLTESTGADDTLLLSIVRLKNIVGNQLQRIVMPTVDEIEESIICENGHFQEAEKDLQGVYEPNKFIVINRKHLQQAKLAVPDAVKDFEDALAWLDECLPDNKYYVCNQDEPYADQVKKIILEGEIYKENASSGVQNGGRYKPDIKTIWDVKEIKVGNNKIKLVADIQVPKDELWFVDENSDMQNLE